MPSVSQNSSRSGLITWLVVFTVLFLTATVVAIYYGVETSRLQKDLTDYKTKYIPKIIADGALTGDTVTKLEAAKSEDPTNYPASMALLDVAAKQRDELATVITGNPGSTVAQAKQAATDALAAAKQSVQGTEVTLPATGSLATSVRDLAGAVATRQASIKQLNDQIQQVQGEKTKIIEQTDAALKQKDQQIADARTESEKARTDVSTYSATKNNSIQQMEGERDKERQAAQEALNQKDIELKKLQNQLMVTTKQVQALQSRLGGLRVNPNESVVRQPDGRIIRVGGDKIVYIDRGAGDQIAPGMTFEVYDKTSGVPAMGEGMSDQNLPAGKASIEVLRVGPASSEARVVNEKPGTLISEGDIIANLVYDPRTKYNFVVFGKFDLDHNGVATAQDAEVLKRLITQWGARVTNDVNVDTDFVVLGAEPAIPTFSADEERDPLVQQKIAAARKEVDDYQTVRRTASELNIPIMNQNRFLYFIGYYDLASR